MANDSAVEFGFQSEIVNLTQLTHLITGRALKALSDGGIDFYSVAAAIWLGKLIPIQSPLQSTVHSHIQMKSKTLLNGFLAKALSIGWNHSAVPFEMSRTKAGTNALLLISALSVGSPSCYCAAECLSELLALYGCEADKAPTVDALKPMVAYLAPFVDDLGFSKVLQHITTTSLATAAKRSPGHVRFLTTGRPEPPIGLTAVGESPVLAAAIKQLILTSQNGEKIHFVTHQRGAWLAAFASHTLGMEVEIILNAQVLWASSGSNGSVVFDLDPTDQQSHAVLRTTNSELHIVDAPLSQEAGKGFNIDYAIPEALDCELARYSSMNQKIRRSVSRAIVRLAFTLYKRCRLTPMEEIRRYCSNGNFQSGCDRALRETLNDFSISPEVIDEALESVFNVESGGFRERDWFDGYSYLNRLEHKDLRSICSIVHKAGNLREFCPCASVGLLILGFATTIVALMHCRYDCSTLRVSAAVLNGSQTTPWTRECRGGSDGRLHFSHEWIFRHLSPLVHVHSDDVEFALGREEQLVGVSNASHTIFYTALVQDDCFDDAARLITISPGRACIQGVLRQLLIEPRLGKDRGTTPLYKAAEFTTLAQGAFLEPHYRPTEMRIFMDASVTEHSIAISTRVGLNIIDSRPIKLFGDRLVKLFLSSMLGKPCGHRLNNKMQLRLGPDDKAAVCGFDSVGKGVLGQDFTMVFVALKGSKLEQLIYLRWLSKRVKGQNFELFWQLHSCLSCSVADARRGGSKPYIIMAG